MGEETLRIGMRKERLVLMGKSHMELLEPNILVQKINIQLVDHGRGSFECFFSTTLFRSSRNFSGEVLRKANDDGEMNPSTPRKLDDFFGGNILIWRERFRMAMGSRREDSSRNAFTAILVLGIGRVAATKPRIKDIKEQNFAGIRMKFGARAVLESR